jgi:signal transduction histidine kinase
VNGPSTPDQLAVLVVEDNAADARQISRLLAESAVPRFRSTVVDSLGAARELLAGGARFDAVLLDLGLPDVQGFDSLASVHAAAPDAPIVVMTVDGREETALEAIRRGAQDYLVKGRFDADALTRSIRYAMSRQVSAVALRRSNEALAAFANAAAHDLREPLRTMSGFAQLVQLRQGERLDDDGREMLEAIVAAGGRGEELIDRLLEYAYSTDAELRLADVAVDDVLDRVLATLSPVLDARDARVTRDDDLPTVRGDEVQLENALRNLVGNAVKHKPAGPPSIHVGARILDGGTRLEVTDDGPGVPSAERERIFRVFAGRTGMSSGPGSGLGLAMVARVAERHGGRAFVEDPPDGQGSVFVLWLPSTQD